MMSRAIAHRVSEPESDTDDLFVRIGAFLGDQHLSPAPEHYAFAHRVLTDTHGSLARVVAQLTDGGVRLSRHEIESLGGLVLAGAAWVAADAQESDVHAADGLVAKTQMQVEGFTDLMQTILQETEHFGRDLAATADAMRDNGRMGTDQVMRLTGAMLARVRSAESRLEAATHEANELRAKLEEARDNARRDPLTGLPNRRAFEEAFAERRHRRAPRCVALCDVDHFKAVNDRFGHAVGDRVLKAIAASLSQGCAGHLVARYGGEEFAILFDGIDPGQAQATLDTVRETVATKRYRLRGTDVPLGEITFSAGITIAAAGEPLNAAFGRADRLLYAAKDCGRNQLQFG